MHGQKNINLFHLLSRWLFRQNHSPTTVKHNPFIFNKIVYYDCVHFNVLISHRVMQCSSTNNDFSVHGLMNLDEAGVDGRIILRWIFRK